MLKKLKPLMHLSCGCLFLISASACAATDDGDKEKKLRTPIPSLEQPTEMTLGKPKKKPIKPRGAHIDQDQQESMAINDLAARLGIAVEDVKLSGAVEVTWRSGALGCPKAGENYTSALVPGLSMMLLANGKAYRYHAKKYAEPFYCPDEQAEQPYMEGADI